MLMRLLPPATTVETFLRRHQLIKLLPVRANKKQIIHKFKAFLTALLILGCSACSTSKAPDSAPSVAKQAKQPSYLRAIWWSQTDKLLQALYELRLTQGKQTSEALAEIAGLASYYEEAALQHGDALIQHIAVKLILLEKIYASKTGVSREEAKTFIANGLHDYVYAGQGRSLALAKNNPLIGRWQWQLGGKGEISETYEFQRDARKRTWSGKSIIDSLYTLLEIQDGTGKTFLLLSTGVQREGEGYFRGDPNTQEGELTVALYIHLIDQNSFDRCEASGRRTCYGISRRTSGMAIVAK